VIVRVVDIGDTVDNHSLMSLTSVEVGNESMSKCI